MKTRVAAAPVTTGQHLGPLSRRSWAANQSLLPLVGGRQLNPPRRCFYLEYRVRSGAARYGGTGEEQRADDSNRRADRAEDYRTEPFGEDGEEGRRRGRRYSTVAAPTTRHIHQMVSRTKTTVADGQGHSFREDDEDVSSGAPPGRRTIFSWYAHARLFRYLVNISPSNTGQSQYSGGDEKKIRLPTMMTDSTRVLESQHVFSRNP
ncbi:hypothetical protein THAOC_12709 [Thalassiosira oceanica]|uniref:Uncharacterized protein n=1 Tax=Thalassiosira oceanica TaxID=159749 RepID=K0T7D0_THAOC|nr:hypothetical protein THAOC_12709 [Thalassiosira oceanica]|eukprot:EJK66377.1 hypothetical protein THAOC_12709 [Thalassiosira oceanica]